jgi:hypothetical protein
MVFISFLGLLGQFWALHLFFIFFAVSALPEP